MLGRFGVSAGSLRLSLAALVAAALILVVRLTPTAAPVQSWEPTIRAFEEQDRTHPPKAGSIVFTGSSSFVFWHSLSEDMKPLAVLNRAFGGSTYSDVNEYVQRIVIVYHPVAVVVYAGDNDLAMSRSNRPEDVTAQVRRFVDAVHGQLPDTWIYVLSIKPSYSRWDIWPQMKKANAFIEAYLKTQPRAQYVDVATAMFGGREKPPRDLFVQDGLHPTAKCYALWTSILKPILMRRFGSPASQSTFERGSKIASLSHTAFALSNPRSVAPPKSP